MKTSTQLRLQCPSQESRFFGRRRSNRQRLTNRNGSIITLSAGVLVMILAFTAFTVDIGWITLARAQMRNACDAAAFAGATEFGPGTGLAPLLTSSSVALEPKDAARLVADANRSGGLDSTYIDVAQDVRLGQYQWLPDELRVEHGISSDTVALLKFKGHKVKEKSVMGAANSILVDVERRIFHGAGDPRRSGIALGLD